MIHIEFGKLSSIHCLPQSTPSGMHARDWSLCEYIPSKRSPGGQISEKVGTCLFMWYNWVLGSWYTGGEIYLSFWQIVLVLCKKKISVV